MPSVDLLRNVVKALADAVVLADADGCMLLVNEEAERLSRYAPDELVGRSIDLLVPALGDGRAEHLRVAVDGRAIGPTVRLRRRDGVDVPVSISLRALVTVDGEHVLAVIREAAPGRDAEAALQLLAEQRRRVADDVDAVIQRLFSVGMSMQHSAQRSRQPELARRLERDVEEIGTAVRDLRATIIALYA